LEALAKIFNGSPVFCSDSLVVRCRCLKEDFRFAMLSKNDEIPMVASSIIGSAVGAR
jgi:hypothetical protein